MTDSNYPQPPSHKTLEFGSITIDSNFDSGNLYSAQKINNNNFNLWIAVDHIKNQYRSWFHFSIQGVSKGALVTFNIKNMQNQSKLLNEGLVPVFREQNSKDWKRIIHKIDLSKIEYNQGWIEWSFKHTMTSEQKVFFAFFYPWSNTQNDFFLKQIQEKCFKQQDIYFKRSTIIKSLEGRPVDFITISSKKCISNKNQKLQDQYLFTNGSQPKQFGVQKKCIIISARVHPGEVPSSHVMTGIISELTQDSQKGRILRDKFVFYLFPVLNPDGVARGHYRVDPNGTNLNRCYINPSPKIHSPIYAIKKAIIHFHSKGKYFGYLDLHAHAARKGVFIYGNATNQLDKQVQICLFPKILSMNSQIFEYQGSNFTQQNMYCKDINDHVSKEGAGRVALFKATKNPYSWTLQCNYNTSRVLNRLQQPRSTLDVLIAPNQKQLQTDLIINYKNPIFKQPKQFYAIEHFHKLGKQICQSFLDLVQLNPESRIDNPKSHFKSVQNLKLNLAVALLRMAPNRFELPFKKIYHSLQGPSSTKEHSERGVKALYYLLIKKARIENIGSFLKAGDESTVVLPFQKAMAKKSSQTPAKEPYTPIRNSRLTKSNGNDLKTRLKPSTGQSKIKFLQGQQDIKTQYQQQNPITLKLTKIQYDYKLDSDDSQAQDPTNNLQLIPNIVTLGSEMPRNIQKAKAYNIFNSQLLQVNFSNGYQRILGKKNDFTIDNIKDYRRSFNPQNKKFNTNTHFDLKKAAIRIAAKNKQLPSIETSKVKAMASISSVAYDLKLVKKANALKEQTVFYIPS